jgi:septum site-determining protein MinD
LSRTVMITSGKGGTGKSMFAVNLGLELQLSGHRTVIVDMDFGMRTLDLYLGAENNALYDIGDVLKGICSIERALITLPSLSGLSFLPAFQNSSRNESSEEELLLVISSLSERFEYVILDGPPGIERISEECGTCIDDAIIVATPDYVSLRDAEAIEDRLLRSGIFSRAYVLNKIEPETAARGCEPGIMEADRHFRSENIGMILYDDNIRISTNLGVPIVAKRDSYIAKNFDQITARFLRMTEQ